MSQVPKKRTKFDEQNAQEFARLRARLEEAASGMQRHHFVWILEAARKYYADQIVEMESQIMRHEHFAGEPEIPRSVHEHDATRAGRLAEARERLTQYRTIYRFICAQEELLEFVKNVTSAQEFATQFWASWGKRK